MRHLGRGVHSTELTFPPEPNHKVGWLPGGNLPYSPQRFSGHGHEYTVISPEVPYTSRLTAPSYFSPFYIVAVSMKSVLDFGI